MSRAVKSLVGGILGCFLFAFYTVAPAEAGEGAVIDWVDELNGITKAHIATHDQIISTTDHGHASHLTFMPSAPPSGGILTVSYFIHSHAGANALSAGQIARIQGAAGVWNGAGANVMLSEVLTDASADIHVHGDSTSGCGGGALGCSEFAFFTAHSGTYADSDSHHEMASNLDGFGTLQELTQLRRSDWYTGASAGGIGASEFDYMTVAIQEFGHHLGLGHNSGASAHADTALSPMNGTLPFGTVRRTLQPADIAAIQHTYGVIPEPGSLMLAILGGAGLVGYGFLRRRKRTA